MKRRETPGGWQNPEIGFVSLFGHSIAFPGIVITHECVSDWSPTGQLPYRREAAVLQHLALVKELATAVRRSLPHPVEENDLIQAGVIGLLDALGSYDASNQIAFSLHAKSQIMGAILDTVRQLDRHDPADPVPVRPSHRSSFPDTGAAYHRRHRQRDGTRDLADCYERQPDCICERNELARTLTHAVRGLPKRYQQVVLLHDVQDMTIKQIGAMLGLSTSRVSQIRHKALRRVSAKLQTFGYAPHRHVRMGLSPRFPGGQAQLRSALS